MLKRTVLFLFVIFLIGGIRAQSVTDSSAKNDTISQMGDTSARRSLPDTAAAGPRVVRLKPRLTDSLRSLKTNAARLFGTDSIRSLKTDSTRLIRTDSARFSEQKPIDFSNLPHSQMDLFAVQTYFNFLGKPLHVRSEQYHRDSYEGIFYLLLAMLFYFALVKLFFAKYLGNLLTLFFRASMRQQQIREQVLQSPIPSILLNVLFIFSAGLYGAFLFRYYHFGNPDKFWIYFLYCTLMLALLYLLKYVILRITGWIFNLNRAVETYLFVVFMTNKIIGIFLLPFLVVISFSGPVITEIAVTASLIMVGIFYVYRLVAAYTTLRKEIKISGLHFFLYLCAFEIAPLLLIYKVLLTYLEKAY